MILNKEKEKKSSHFETQETTDVKKLLLLKKKISILKLYDINETRKGGAERKHEIIRYNILHTVCENKQ